MTRTFNFKLVWLIMGALLLLEALFMLLSTGVARLYDEADVWPILYSALITLAAGIISLLSGRKAERRIGKREGYVIVASVWVVFTIFGLLPFWLSGAIPDYTDAFFETMSGFTTTGSSVLTDIEALSHGLLFWRSLIQWLGGMGIIVLSLAILPIFGISGTQLYAAEVTGVTYEKLRPRIKDTAKLLWGIYVLLTAVETLCLMLLGVGWFDAVCHSFTTLATGGFSTKNIGLAAFTPVVQYVVTLFMLLAGINFGMLYFVMKGNWKRLRQEEELYWYFGAVVCFTVAIFFGLFLSRADYSFTAAEEAFRSSVFVVVSTMTTTGFSGVNYELWSPFLLVLVIILMFTGASAGSTSGGIKWSRIAIWCKNSLCEFKRLVHPNAIIPVRMNGKAVPAPVLSNIMAFMFLYMAITLIGIILFSLLGVPLLEAFGAAVSSIGNIGPGLGFAGPAGNFALMPVAVKWIMSFFMLLGRLELFTVLVMLTPSFWGK